MHCFNASLHVHIIRRRRCSYNSPRRRIIQVGTNSFEKLSCTRLAASLMDRECIYFLFSRVRDHCTFVGNLFIYKLLLSYYTKGGRYVTGIRILDNNIRRSSRNPTIVLLYRLYTTTDSRQHNIDM